ncbi:hypothetical protein [Pseudobythopirellula maris]|nr:hypothetical protein [Pseudobythopirellula maris]
MSFAYGVSADGSVIVGASSSELSHSHHPVYREPFVWTASEGMQGLGYIPGTDGRYGAAYAVSDNGLVVVGTSTGNRQSGGTRPFRWTDETGMADLGDLDDEWGNQDGAGAINSDGTVIVGRSQLGRDRMAFRWTPEFGMQALGTLLTEASGDREKFSSASDTSEDGSVVVGYAYSDGGSIEAFRWTPVGGMRGLGRLPGAEAGSSGAYGVTPDGVIVVGDARDENGQHAILWDQFGRMRLLEDVLVSQGAAPAIGGGTLRIATDISDDGRTIIGGGFGPNGSRSWIAVLAPEPSSLLLLLMSFALGACHRTQRGRSNTRAA